MFFFFFAFISEGKSQVINAWINEFHYDNDGTDAFESVELVVKRADTLNLSWLIVTRYNGSGGVVYGSDNVSAFTAGDTLGDFYLFSIVYPSGGLQNGAPDGLALSYNGVLIQFVSYEGSFAATAGPAIGVTSIDIGVSQNADPTGTSLQLVGYDTAYSGFTWVGGVLASRGEANANQTIGVDAQAPVFTAGYPNASNISETTIHLNVRMNEAGKVFYVVQADGSPVPDIATVKTGDTLLVSNIATDTTVIISGLSHGTSYDVYVLAEDNAAGLNTQATVSLVEVTTQLARTLNLLGPLDRASLTLSDTSWIRFTATLIDSVAFWYYNPLISNFVKADNNYSAGLDSVPVVLPQRFSYFDSLTVYLADASDTAFTSDTNVYFLIDNQSPMVTSLFPMNNSVITGNEVFTIKFNEYVLEGSSDSIMIYSRADSTLIDVLNVGADSVWVSHLTSGNSISSTLNFVPNYSFEPSSCYYILISEGTVTDKQNNTFQLLLDTVWNFCTPDQQIVDVASLAEFRSYLGSMAIFRITGEVVLTAQMPFQNKKYLQDSAAGILIKDPSGVITTTYQPGDGITNLFGTIASDSNGVVLIPQADPGSPSSTGNTVKVQTIGIAEFNSNLAAYESELIRIENIEFVNAGGSFANGSNYKIFLNTDTTICRVDFYSTDLTGIVIPDSASITGIAGRYYSAAQIFPRYKADVVELLPVIPLSDVADLNFIKVDGATIAGFDKDQLNYTYLVAFSATAIPVITYELADPNASAVLIDAVSLPGATTIEVVAEDGKSAKKYLVEFEKQANGVSQKNEDEVTFFPLPVSERLTITNTQSFVRLEVINLTGSRVYETNTSGAESVKIDVSDWNSGLYILRLVSGDEIVTKRFIVK